MVSKLKYSGLMIVSDFNTRRLNDNTSRYSGLLKIAELSEKHAQEDDTPRLLPSYSTLVGKLTSKLKNPAAQAGVGIGATLAPYYIPIARTAVPAASAVSDAVNVFTPGLTGKQRFAYGASAATDSVLAALGLISDIGSGVSGGTLAAPTSAATGGLATLLRSTKWFKWLQNMKNSTTAGKGAYKFLQGSLPWQKNYHAWANATKFNNPILKKMHTLPKRTLHLFTGNPYGTVFTGTSLVGGLVPGAPGEYGGFSPPQVKDYYNAHTYTPMNVPQALPQPNLRTNLNNYYQGYSY